MQRLPDLIAAFVNSARSSSRCAAGHLASAAAPVLHSTKQTISTRPGPYFLTVALSSLHTTKLVGKWENNQRKMHSKFFFPRQSGDLVHSLTRYTLAHFCTAGGESIRKTCQNSNIGGRQRKELSTAPKTHLDLVSLCAAGHNIGGWNEFVTFACKLRRRRRRRRHLLIPQWGNADFHQHRTRMVKRRRGEDDMLLFSARGGQCV